MTALRVLSVGYPLARVSPESAGGAEQILGAIDRAMVAAGHDSVVIAPEGSTVAGRLHAIPFQAVCLGENARQAAQADTRRAIEAVLEREVIHLVHCHGLDFDAYLPPPGPPVLATLHLPPDWYSRGALCPDRPDTWIHAVSATQHAACPPSPRLLPPIENGVPLDTLRARHARRRFALVLSRICPEKGIHCAIEAAGRARMPLLIAGQVHAYPEHQRYFEEAIRPKLGPDCRFLGPVGFARKRRLLSAAHCLLVPSLAAETSSLVAREAAACGTPVVAFPNGALVDTVEQGRTGFLVPDVEAMAQMIAACGTIDPDTCRAVAANRFSERTMTNAYLARYRMLAR